MADMRRVLTALLPSRRYAVRIRALNKFGISSNWSEALEFVTPADDSVPNAPENLVVDFETPNLTLQWDAVQENTDGTVLVDFSHYEIVLITPEQNTTVLETSQKFLFYTFAQNKQDFGTPQPIFSVAVYAVDFSGVRSAPLLGEAINPAPSKPQPPTGTVAISMMAISMAPNPVDPDIKEYLVERAVGAGSFSQVAVTTGDTYIDTGTHGQTYYFRYRVRDYFDQESEEYSEILQLSPQGMPDLDTDPPVAVEDFAIDNVGLNEITGEPFVDLIWTPNNVDDDLSHFELRILRTGDSFVNSIMIGPGASSYRVEGLQGDTEYTFLMYAYDFSGNRSGPSAELTITTPSPDTIPDPPMNTGVVSSFRSLTVYWDSVFNPQFSHYEAYGSTTQSFTPDEDLGSNLLFSGNASRFMHPVGDNETWYFQVRTINKNGMPSSFTPEFSGSSPDGIQSNEPGGPSDAQFRVDAYGNMWIGGEDFVDAPFSVSNVGSALMRNVIITGEDMDAGERIIDTPSFIVTKEGQVTAFEINATGGTIGGVTVNETNLTGGEINGSTFNIGAGGINFTGSGNITWADTASGGIELAHLGFINNSSYRNDNTTGWQIDDSGIIINEGTVSANAIQIGVSSENLLVNSAFTEGTTVATNWATTTGGGATAVYSVSNTLWAYLGRSQHLEITAAGTWAGVRQDVVRASAHDFEPDETITISFWVRQAVGTARTAKVFVQTPAGATLWDGNNISLTVGAWTRVTAVFRLGNPQPELRVSLRINSPQVGNEFYIDGAQLHISDFITDYAPRTLEIPTNYIQSANIASLSAGKITSGQIATAELILTGAGTIRNSPQTWQIDADGAVFENGGITLMGGGEGGLGYVKLDASSFRLIAGSDTDNSTNTKFKVDRTGVYIGGSDAGSAQVYFDTDTDKTIFTGKSTSNVFIIDTDPDLEPSGLDDVDDVRKVLSLKKGPLDSFYLTDGGEAYFLGGVIGGSTQIHPETIVAGGITNLINFDGGGFEHFGAGGVFRLDGMGLKFWDNPAAVGDPVIFLDSDTGNATFSGELSAATGTFAGELSAATGTFSGNLSAAGGTFAGSLSAATGTFSGNLSAAGGTFTGQLSAATGSFSGSITATGGSITGNLSVTGSLTGGTITGALFRTAASGARLEIDQSDRDRVKFFNPSNQLRGFVGYEGNTLYLRASSGTDVVHIRGSGALELQALSWTRIASGTLCQIVEGSGMTSIAEFEDSRVRIFRDMKNTTAASNNIATSSSNGWVCADSNYIAVNRQDFTPLWVTRTGTDGTLISIRKSGTERGSISISGTTTSYNTSSDYRLKENDNPIPNPTDKLMLLRPIEFDWKDTDVQRSMGFFAHEVQEVIPDAVYGEKDAVTEDDEPSYQGMDHSKLIPLLTAALQEAIERIELLEQV